MRMIIPESTIKGKRAGIILENQRFSPFKDKERHWEGKHKMIAPRTIARTE